MRKVLSILFLVCIDSMVESGNRVLEEKVEDKNDIWKLGSNFRQISRKMASSGGGQKPSKWALEQSQKSTKPIEPIAGPNGPSKTSSNSIINTEIQIYKSIICKFLLRKRNKHIRCEWIGHSKTKWGGSPQEKQKGSIQKQNWEDEEKNQATEEKL